MMCSLAPTRRPYLALSLSLSLSLSHHLNRRSDNLIWSYIKSSMAEATKRYAVVTGANKGIGLETVKQLASKARLSQGLDFEVNNAGIGGVKLHADAFKASEYSGGGEKFNLSNEPHGNIPLHKSIS